MADEYLECMMKQYAADTIPDLDNPPPRLQIDTFPKSATPEFYYYLGWTDLRATQEKFIRERKGFTQRWLMLKENLSALFTDQLENVGRYDQVNYGNGCPNPFYQIAVEDALDVANREPLRLIEPYHKHLVAIPWKAPRPDICTRCLKEFDQFLWIEEGPCFDGVYCSEECIRYDTIRYLERDNMIRLMAEGQLDRALYNGQLVTLDKSVAKLAEMLAALPIRSDPGAGKQKSGFGFNE